MKKQKVLSLLLAMALIVSLATTALAVELDETNSKTEIVINGTVNLPTIKVTIGPITDIVANPYKMSYKPNGDPIDDSAIVTSATTIKNESTIDVDITAEPSLSTSSNDLIVLTSAIKDRTKKSIFLEYNMDVITNKGTHADLETAASKYDGTTGEHKPIKKVGDSPLEKAKITLNKIDTANSVNETWGAFKITGDCSGTGWTSDDAVTVKVTFDIAPVIPSA